MTDLSNFWPALRAVFEEQLTKEELLAASVTVLVRNSDDVITMKNYFYPSEEQK